MRRPRNEKAVQVCRSSSYTTHSSSSHLCQSSYQVREQCANYCGVLCCKQCANYCGALCCKQCANSSCVIRVLARAHTQTRTLAL